MDEPSGLLKAGTILLLVGAIMSAIGAFFLIAFAFAFGLVMDSLGEAAGPWIALMYGIIGVMLGIGSGFGFVGYNRARNGDASAGFVMGLVSSLLPPVQAIQLVGGVLCKASPEAQSQ